MTEVDITRLTIVRCQKCQRGVSLLFYRSYDEIAVHYCRRCDYTFATDLRGKLLGHIEWAKARLWKKYTQEKFHGQTARLITNWSNSKRISEDTQRILSQYLTHTD